MCSLGYVIKKGKKRNKQNKGEIRRGTVQRALPRQLRETRARAKEENNKNERVYSWQKSVITDWGLRACGSIILKRDMRLVAMNEMRVVEMRQEEQIPNGAGEAGNGAMMTRVFAPHESVHCASSSFSVAATRTRP